MILKLVKRIYIVIATWLGIDSIMEANGIRAALMVETRNNRRIIPLHHLQVTFAVRTFTHWLRYHAGGRTCPYEDEGRADRDHEDFDRDDEDFGGYSPPFPDESQTQFFNEYLEMVEGLGRSDDLPSGPMHDLSVASHRELVRTIGVDIQDEEVWRGVVFGFYALHSYVVNCERAHTPWPHPMILSNSLAGLMTQVRDSMLQEAEDIERLGDDFGGLGE